MTLATSDQQAPAVGKVDAVNEDLGVDLACWFYLRSRNAPAPLPVTALSSQAGASHVCLCAGARHIFKESGQNSCVGNIWPSSTEAVWILAAGRAPVSDSSVAVPILQDWATRADGEGSC